MHVQDRALRKVIERLEERLQCRVAEIDAFRVQLHPDTNGDKLSVK